MELLTLIAALFVAISFLMVPCASDQLNVQESREQVDDAKVTIPSLPRKLKLSEEALTVKYSADRDLTQHKKFIDSSSGTKQHEKEENVMHAAEKETSWADQEGPNKSEYFTMDYGWPARRRRPIHNKQIPLVP